jgi:hypothetical protein
MPMFNRTEDFLVARLVHTQYAQFLIREDGLRKYPNFMKRVRADFEKIVKFVRRGDHVKAPCFIFTGRRPIIGKLLRTE